jgi:hypothetical protein
MFFSPPLLKEKTCFVLLFSFFFSTPFISLGYNWNMKWNFHFFTDVRVALPVCELWLGRHTVPLNI